MVSGAFAQLTVTGTVYDSTKTIPVRNVLVQSSSGTSVYTDTLGVYNIVTTDKDSLTFIYNNKPTAKFAVKQINDISSFDISLHVRVSERFRTMKEVRVFSKSYRQDSIANREQYAKIFKYQKPGISTSSSDYSGATGLDLDEFINIFRFRRNKQLKYMQQRLMQEEQENYVKYRFNKVLVRRITRLEGSQLDTFMVQYQPDFQFTINATQVDFYQYILNASYQFRKELLNINVRKDEP